MTGGPARKTVLGAFLARAFPLGRKWSVRGCPFLAAQFLAKKRRWCAVSIRTMGARQDEGRRYDNVVGSKVSEGWARGRSP